MRTTFTFNSNIETLSDYMTRVIAILRAIRDNVSAADGIDYSMEFTEAEKLELHQQVLTLAITEMEKTAGKHCIKKHNFDQDSEDFISNFKIVISDNLLSFNDSDHFEDGETRYQFSTFLKHLSPEAVMDYLDGRMSVDQLMEEDGLEGEAFEDKNNEDPDLKNEVMDINVERLFDAFLGKMTDVEKFFTLIEVGCLEKYETLTASQLSVDSMFLNLIATDAKYSKNIQVGDVVIKKTNRQAYNDRDV